MLGNKNRIGNLTNSEIYRLLGSKNREMTPEEKELYKKENPKGMKKNIEDHSLFSDAAINYIIEKMDERKLKRSIDNESSANSLKWGKCLEYYGFIKVNDNFEYQLLGDESKVHDVYNYWSGSVDVLKTDTAGDIKCPYTLKSFISLIRPLYHNFNGLEAFNALRNGFNSNGIFYEKHKDAEKYYWQIVGNAILHNKKFGELIIYMPYESDLELIKEDLDGNPDYYFINFANENDLPYLPDDSEFKDINVIRFEIPKEDKEYLLSKIKQAEKYFKNL